MAVVFAAVVVVVVGTRVLEIVGIRGFEHFDISCCCCYHW